MSKSALQPKLHGGIFADPLSLVIESLAMRGIVPGLFEMHAPWGLEFGRFGSDEARRHISSIGLPPPPGRPPRIIGMFFAVLRGSCWLQAPHLQRPLALAGGDFVLVNGEEPCSIRDDQKTSATPFFKMLSRAHVEQELNFSGGGKGAPASFIHGIYVSQDEADNPLLKSIPRVVQIRADQVGVAQRVQDTMRLLTNELFDRRPGGRGIINHLAQIAYIEALRVHFAGLREGTSPSWFKGLLDPDIGLALSVMHTHPEEQWTVAALAQRVLMSRSKFAERFMKTVGTSPLQYLTDCRMRRAKELLRNEHLGLKDVACRVGYANESAFSNAFRRFTGTTPGVYRKQQP